ncbi:hypothetical protein ADL00_06730 [Streptomyces sp. AS58]|nr:hypothetical protein ADL00_06730 [Streptomyces sp. AS58]
MPDQQAGEHEDPWEVPTPAAGRGARDDERAEDGDAAASDVPDTDEAGTGRKGAPRSSTAHPEHPDPDESPA